ncbi:hypothetical protein QUC31_010031 [Theobroma cacao]
MEGVLLQVVMADPVSIIVGPIVNNIIDTAASLIKGEFLAILNVEKERKKQVRKILAPTNLINKSSVAHKIKEISARLDVIAKQKNDFHLTESSDGGKTPNLPHTPFFVDITADVFGRESDRDELINRMLSNESDTEGDVSVIPIVGMGGLGKTTLAQLIFKDERVKNHFEFKMWVHVTVDFNFGRILKEMIEFHTEMKYSSDVPTRTLESRFLEFLAGKSFLLVLDDVWTDDYQEWEPLQNLLKQGGKGSRVLVTTRNTRVSDIMGTQPPYRLECLPEDECWSLFKKIAFKDCDSLVGTHRKELEVYGRQIVGKCNGLPLAVKAMGGVLRGIFSEETRHVSLLGQDVENPTLQIIERSTKLRTLLLPVLKIKKCDSLKALPMAPLMFLVLIDNLVLEDWKEGMFIAQDDQGNQVGQPKPTLISLLELKMANCPNIQALPKIFAPQKLEISGCGLITALPVPQFAQRLQHLALDSCFNGTLVRAIPGTNTLYSLVISNISNLTSFPKLPHLPGLKTLYISDCKDLTSLSEDEESLKSLSSLKLLSIQGCSKLESLPDEGLPTGLECLMIVSCPILKSLGTKDTLKSLLSLKDLYLDDCPLIRSFPEDGLPTSLLHLVIHECPLLIEQCQKEDAGSTEWPKIMHVTDQEIDSIRLPSAPDLPKKNKWTPLFGFSKGVIHDELIIGMLLF